MPTPAVLNVGFYNYVLTEKVVALVSSESAPMRRLVQTLRKGGTLIDATQGRRTKSIIMSTMKCVRGTRRITEATRPIAAEGDR